MRSDSRLMGSRADLEARYRCLLEEALSYVNSVESRLTTIGGLLHSTQLTSAELIWRVLYVQALEQTRALERTINLLEQLREDVVDLSH